MTMTSDVHHFNSRDLGEGLPYGIISNQDPEFLMENLLVPSLRDFHVILWFKRGKGTYFVDFEEHKFGPDTLILLSKDQLNYIVPPEGDWQLQTIVFDPDFIYRNDTDLKYLFNFSMGCHREGQQVLFPEKDKAQRLNEIATHLRRVFTEWQGKRAADAFYHWLCLFLIECEEMQEQPDEPLEIDEDTKLMLAFNDLLEQHFKTEYKVEFYLEELGMTNKSLARITKNKYKLAPKAVIDERRILEIKRQLKGTSKPIKNIAYEMGFDEPTNMVKYFKKHTGETPNGFKNDQNP